MKGMTRRINGAFFQVGKLIVDAGIQGVGYSKQSPVLSIKKESIKNAGITGWWEKLPALSKKDKANGLKKIEQVAKKRKYCLSEKKISSSVCRKQRA